MPQNASLLPSEVKHKGASVVCNEIVRKKNVKLKMQIHKMSLDEGIENLNLNKKLY
jgi:hypothetical protein